MFCIFRSDREKIAEGLQAPFFLATDGSQDIDDAKQYPIVVKYFCNKAEKVVTVLLSVSEVKGSSTGDAIFKVIDQELKKHNILWVNCLSFSTDNANVMSGLKKGVAAFVLQQNDMYTLWVALATRFI